MKCQKCGSELTFEFLNKEKKTVVATCPNHGFNHPDASPYLREQHRKPSTIVAPAFDGDSGSQDYTQAVTG